LLCKAITNVLVLSVLAGFLMSSCGATPTPVAPDPLDALEDAVQTTIRSQVRDALASDLARYEVRSSAWLSEGRFGRVEARIVLGACPLFSYDLPYNGELREGEWVLYNDAETLVNLFKSWATARSAALGGGSVSVPGAAAERQVMLIPDAVPELMQARLDGLSNATVDPLVGFFVCSEEDIRWEALDQTVSQSLRELIPQVRELMEGELAAG
jgi:hypothetical protein